VKNPTRASVDIHRALGDFSERPSRPSLQQQQQQQQQAHNINITVHALAFHTVTARIHYELSKVRSSSIVASCVAVVVLRALHPFARCASRPRLLAFEFLCERGVNVQFLASFALVLL
jgi:hypothetical protein